MWFSNIQYSSKTVIPSYVKKFKRYIKCGISGLNIAQLLAKRPCFKRIFCALLKFENILSIQYSSKTYF